LYIIDQNVQFALPEEKKLNHQSLDGKPLATRKNPPAIAVGLEQSFQLSCWYIMWMAISTTAA
jgi:hypothetical protein